MMAFHRCDIPFQAAERESVEAVRLEKLAGLEAGGVPQKYRAELASKRLVNW